MPAISLPLLSASVGLFLSWSARTRGGNVANPGTTTWLLVAYALLVHAPVSATLLSLNPDWTFAYLMGPRRLQTATLVAVSLCVAVAVPFGFYVGSRRGRRRSPIAWLLWSAPALLAVSVNTLVFIGPLTKDASYVEYHNDFGVQSLAGSALGYSLIWAALILAIALAFTHTTLRRLARNEQTAPGPHSLSHH